MITFKEFQRQSKIAEKLVKKFTNNKMTEADRQEWLDLDLGIRMTAIRNEDDEQERAEDWAYHNQ